MSYPILPDEFDANVFRCHDGSPTPAALIPRLAHVHAMLIELKHALEAKYSPDHPLEITIMSGYRSPAWNTKVGGEPHSMHMLGLAADIKVGGIAPDKVADMADELQTKGVITMGGVGRYQTFSHVDCRGYHARWDKR